MTTHRAAARTIASLMLAQMLAAPIVNFALLAPFSASRFLREAAAHATETGIAVVVGLVMIAATLGIAIAALPVLRRCSEAMALWLVALAVVALAAAVVENIGLLSMLSLSQTYAKTDGATPETFAALAAAVAAPRIWAHYIGLLLSGTFALVFYAALFRFALVPRVLAAFGIGAALLEMIAVALPLFGGHIVFPMLAPLGLAHLALVAWLFAKGFSDRAEDAR